MMTTDDAAAPDLRSLNDRLVAADQNAVAASVGCALSRSAVIETLEATPRTTMTAEQKTSIAPPGGPECGVRRDFRGGP